MNVVFKVIALLFLTLIPLQTLAVGPTPRTCIFAYFNFNREIVCKLAENFEIVVVHDNKRNWNPVFRDSNSVKWRRSQPVLLVYKDCLSLIGPGNPWDSLGDLSSGGGATVGGFWHFDSIFRGLGRRADTFFLMASDTSSHRDSDNRVKIGSGNQWQYRWAMDYGKEYWAQFFACTSKVQCLRNFSDRMYDSTYFDGVFLDNILFFSREYGSYPRKYWNPGNPERGDYLLQSATLSFLRTVSNEYHKIRTPGGYGRRILAIANINKAWQKPGLWQEYIASLDGGMEETYFADTTLTFAQWQRIIDDIRYAESKGKICFVHKAIESEYISQYDPLSVTWFDSTQMMYGLACYLMAFDSTSFFSFGGDYQHVFWASILELDIGKPLGTYRMRADSLIYRGFEKGMVYCNPNPVEKLIYISSDEYYMVSPSSDTSTVNGMVLRPYRAVILKLRESN